MPTFDTPQPISATVEPVVGNVRIIASDRTDTVVDVRPTNESDDSDIKAAEQTSVDYAAGTLTVKAPRQRPLDLTNKSRSIDVTIELPSGSRLNGNTGAGDLYGTGRLGQCRYKAGAGHIQLDHTGEVHLTTGAGNIAVEQVAGKAEISTGSGRVSVGELGGTAEVKNSNGSTTVGTVTGTIRVRSANGDVTVDQAGDNVDVKTANGSVRANELARGRAVLETAMGDIEIGVREGTAAWVDARSRFGRVTNTMTASEAPDKAAETVEVRAHTAFGEITIRRS
jgi:DUF4097 and DUF4098 domain-containing protein YvlB